MADALDTSNPKYAGVPDPQSRTHAYDTAQPLEADEPDRVTQEVNAFEEDATQHRAQPVPTESWLEESDQTTPQPWND